MTWNEVADHLQQSIQHLDLVQHDTITDLILSDDPVLQEYVTEFELSRSEPEKVKTLLIRMILDGQNAQTVDSILDITTTLGNWTTQSALRDALGVITNAIR